MVINNNNVIDKAIELDNSELFNIHRWSDYPEVNSLVDKLYLDLLSDSSFSGNFKIRKKHIKTIVLDLYVKYLKDASMYVSVYLAKWYYDSLESRYNKLHISKLTPIIIHALHEKGYIDLVPGHYSRESDHGSHITRIRAKPYLVELIIRDNIKAEMIERHPSTETIILRIFDEEGKRKLDIAYEDTDKTNIWRANLVAYNNLLRRTYIDVISAPSNGIPCKQSEKSRLSGKPPRKIRITQHEKFVHRVFNNGSWDDGGRFYGGWWQRLSEVWRAQIRIWNSPVTEIDYKSLHIHLLYRQKNIEFNGDPYQLKSYPRYNGDKDMRTFLKLVLLCSINASDKTKAIHAINKEINFNPDEFGWVAEDKLDLGDLIDAFIKEHFALKDDFFSGNGVKLQNLDSLIAEKIINHFTAQDIPVLCIHDSFVIATDKAVELKMIMEKSYVEALMELGLNKGIEPSTDSTGMDLGLFKHMLINPQWHELKESFLNERFDYPDWTNRMDKFKALNLQTDYYY